MRALIKKLEAAAEGSDDLDWQIAKATGLYEEPDAGVYGYAPFTTSLDAALTLVPEGYWWGVRDMNHPLGGANAHVGLQTNKTPEVYVARTGPLALCIATLKAREAQA